MLFREECNSKFAKLSKFLLTSLLCFFISQQPALADRPVTSFFTSNVGATADNNAGLPYASGCNALELPNCAAAGSDVNLNFGAGSNITLTGFTVDIAGTSTFFEPSLGNTGGTGLLDRVVFNRKGTAVTGFDQTQQIFFEEDVASFVPSPAPSGTGTVVVQPNRSDNLTDAMLSLTINRGIDNTFKNINTGAGADETRNNLERIDYISDAGITVAAADADTVGFSVLERGTGDNFRIAAITGLTAGVPSSYGPLIEVQTPWGGANATGIRQWAVLRQDDPTTPSTPPLLPSHKVTNQGVVGRFFTIGDLFTGVAATPTRTVFGYSLFPNDVGGGGTTTTGGIEIVDAPGDLVNIASANFPTNTPGNATTGGLDLIAGGAVFASPTSQDFGIFKRITNLTDSTGAPLNGTLDFTTEQETTGLAAVVKSAGIDPVGLTNITNVSLSSGDQIEYTIYYASPTSISSAVNICDRTPSGTSFITDAFGATSGIQVIDPGNTVGAATTHTTANDEADTGRFESPAVSAFCSGSSGTGGGVIEEGLTVNAGQAGRLTFRVSVD
ncbi:MAG: hypothetical protein ACFB12_09575 [Leptolyngbyaceae cyanobacterium]